MLPRKPAPLAMPIPKQSELFSMPHFPETGDPDASFYTALGFMTATWAFVELYLDLAIALIHGAAGGDTVERAIPRTFARKVSFLKKCFARTSILSGQKKDADALLVRAKELAHHRHFLSHGVALASHKQLFRLVAKPYWHESETGNISTSEIIALTLKMLTLAHDLSDFVPTLVEQLGDIPIRRSERS